MNEKAMEKEKGRFDEIAEDVILPIMRKIDSVAFHGMFNDKDDFVPTIIKKGILEDLEKIIEHLESRISYLDSASIIGFSMGKDGLRPGQKFRKMLALAIAIRDLIKARNDQLQDELEYLRKHNREDHIAEMLGF